MADRPDLTQSTTEQLRTMLESPSEYDQLYALMELTDRAYGPAPEMGHRQ
jgi:hypothetical protein